MRIIYSVVAFLVSSCAQTPAISSQEQSAFEVCDKSVSNSLISPSTYKVVWRSYNDRGPISYDDYRDRARKYFATQEAIFQSLGDVDRLLLAVGKKSFNDPHEDRAFYDNSGFRKEPVTGFVLVEYDSSNRRGVPIRSFSYCRVNGLSPEGKFTSVYDFGLVDRVVAEAAKTEQLRGQK